MNQIKVSIRVALIFVATGLTSCTRSSQESGNLAAQHSSAPPPTPVATAGGNQNSEDMGRHWVQSDQLRTLMKELSARTDRNWPKDVPPDPEDRQTGDLHHAMGSATKLADGLAAAALRIPASVTNAKMSEADRAGFEAEAITLHDQAVRLGLAARANKVEQMQRCLDAISSTCTSCHTRYRDLSGQLNVRQVSADSPR